MVNALRVIFILVATIIAMGIVPGTQAYAQDNPYRLEEGWAKLPAGRVWGRTGAVEVDRDGNIWVFERCGVVEANSCAGSSLDPILKFDPSGRLLKSFGAGMFIWPHGLHVDRNGNVWVTDAGAKDGKGNIVVKFSAEGKVLLTLGKVGMSGDGPDTFNMPSDVVTSPVNGDIFVADGHDPKSNARIVKFSKDGKFIKTWGRRGTGPGEFGSPHAIAMDSKGRIFVGDRTNNRIQIFDQDGKFLEEWKQFGRPSGLFIDRNDILYVTDSQSNPKTNPGFKMGIRIGSLKDGAVRSLIPTVGPEDRPSITEGVTADAMGNVWGAETQTANLRKYVKQQ